MTVDPDPATAVHSVGATTGLATGELQGELLTCQWHNWKFCVADGTAVVGEEAVACHHVRAHGDEILVEIKTPSAAERQAVLWPSIRGAIENDYRGQIARDTARLLDADANPADIVWEGIRVGAPSTHYGVGHEMASAADCLAAVELFDGDTADRTLPIVHALTGISETTRGRPAHDPAPPDASIDFLSAVEDENADEAVAAVRAIYVQKAFELLERAGWQRADDLVPHLTRSIVYGTREDTLPYMSKTMRDLNRIDLDDMAALHDGPSDSWVGRDGLVATLLDSQEAPIELAAEAVAGGAGVTGPLGVEPSPVLGHGPVGIVHRVHESRHRAA